MCVDLSIGPICASTFSNAATDSPLRVGLGAGVDTSEVPGLRFANKDLRNLSTWVSSGRYYEVRGIIPQPSLTA